MAIQKSFYVLGESVDVLVSGEMTEGRVTVITQNSPLGGGLPRHIHERKDETFTVLEGNFEMFDGVAWHPLGKGESYLGERGKPHTFRCTGATEGKMHIVMTPAGMDKYLERISHIALPAGLPELMRISEEHGIKFL